MPNEPAIPRWLPSERPRERLLAAGPAVLANSELAGLLIGSGVRTRNGSRTAVAVAHALLASHGSLRRMSARDPREWMRTPGIGPAGAARLAAAFEVGRRVAAEPLADPFVIREPSDVARFVAPHMRDLTHEEFRVLLLSTAGTVTGSFLASRGGLAASIVEPRAVFRRAILDAAASVICVHNHPSGNLEPSREDVTVTRQLTEAGRILGIPLRDHVIVAGDGFTSLAQRGVL